MVTNPDEDPTNKMVSISAAKNGKITMKASDAFSNGLVKFRIPFFSVLLGGGLKFYKTFRTFRSKNSISKLTQERRLAI